MFSLRKRSDPPARQPRRARFGVLASVVFLGMVALACFGTAWWSLPRVAEGDTRGANLPPVWVTPHEDQAQRIADLQASGGGPARFLMGSDALGRSLLVRCLAGGSISLLIGFAAALLSVFIGTLYGAMAGYLGGRIDDIMMRIVDVLYGLPYVLVVVLLAVARMRSFRNGCRARASVHRLSPPTSVRRACGRAKQRRKPGAGLKTGP